MDLLYHRYSNPLEFMYSYMDQGQFGDFVDKILRLEADRKREKLEKEEEWKLWIMYCHSYSDKSFMDWKNSLIRSSDDKKVITKDEVLSDPNVNRVLNRLFESE